jgi:phenylalanyl-tRNA synthetase beta chain
MLDTLARRAEYNLARMQGNIRFFEIGSVFEPRSRTELPYEELRVGILVTGRRQPPHFSDPKSPEFGAWAVFDQWDAKGIAERVATLAYPSSSVALVDGDGAERLWDVTVDGKPMGVVRRVALDAPVWAAPAFGIELSLGAMDSAQVAAPGSSAHRPPARGSSQPPKYRPLPVTPASEFDLALLVPDSVRANQVESVMKRVSGKLLERVELFDRYVGRGVEPGHQSLAWRLTFRHAERTLRDREIEARRSDILRALADELNVRQRTN